MGGEQDGARLAVGEVADQLQHHLLVTGPAHQHHIAHAPAKSGTKRLRNQGHAALALHLAAQRRQHAGQGIQQGAFSSAIGAQHRPDLTGPAGQRERGEERLTVAIA